LLKTKLITRRLSPQLHCFLEESLLSNLFTASNVAFFAGLMLSVKPNIKFKMLNKWICHFFLFKRSISRSVIKKQGRNAHKTFYNNNKLDKKLKLLLMKVFHCFRKAV